MTFRLPLLFFISSTHLFVAIYAQTNNVNRYNAFDNDLYESVLDPGQCQKQLEYIKSANGTMLRMQFIESGLRIPRGILKGNLMDLGNYPQCLSINENVEDMTISGKYCTISVPLSIANAMEFGLENKYFNDDIINEMKGLNITKDLLLAVDGVDPSITNRNAFLPPSEYMPVSLTLAVCLPKPCTTKEALNGLYFEMGDIHSMYTDGFCRLPDDKPKVTIYYIAWAVVFVLCLCTLLSTGYDVHHRVILKKDPKEASELLCAFSAYKNIQNLVKINSKPGSLDCLDGLRAFSITWVIIGHTFILITVLPANFLDLQEWITSWRAIWLTSAPFAVDTFFLLSGLLVVYTTAKKVTTIQLLKNLHFFYLLRILRVFPVLAAMILFRTSFYNHIDDGPMWPTIIGGNVETCRSFWWQTLLFVQNFMEPSNVCLIEAWYLGIDIQLHILSPLVLFWILSGKKRFAWFGLTSGVLVSFVAATVYIFANKFNRPNFDGQFKKYYVNILTRAPPFFVGLLYGYMLHLYRDKKLIMNKILGYLLTTFAIGMLALIIYCDYLFINGRFSSSVVNNLCMSFLRTFWVVAVGWLIFACVNGYTGPINWFLSLAVWKIPARISYAMYLTHMTIIYIYYGTSIQLIHFSVGSVMFDFFAFLFLTMFISFFVTALIDAPFATLIRILLVKDNKRQKTEENMSKTITKNDTNAP